MINEQTVESPTRKERQELRQQEKQKLEENRLSKMKKQKFAKWLIWLFVLGILVYGLVYISSKSQARPGEAMSIQGQDHIAIGESHVEYNSNPPTSGPHYDNPANWGMYQTELPDEQLIHNLEHGGVWISYRDIDEDTKTKLETLSKRFSNSVIITPRAKNDTPIAITSWGRLLELQSFNEAIIVEFIKSNVNRSPEPLAR